MLKKYMDEFSLIILIHDIVIKDSLCYQDIPIKIIDRQDGKLRTNEISSVKVLWRNQFVQEATWEAVEDMKNRYSYLLESGEVPYLGTNTFLGFFLLGILCYFAYRVFELGVRHNHIQPTLSNLNRG